MLGHIWSWSQFYNFLRSLVVETSVNPTEEIFRPVSVTDSSFYYVLVKNPNFGLGDVASHYWDDKKSDIGRRFEIQSAVMQATIPLKAAAIFAFGPGAAALGGVILDQLVTQAIWGPSNTFDMYRDLYNVVTTKEIGGTRLYGHSVRSR